jgi:cytochrome c-type biogenesis protein
MCLGLWRSFKVQSDMAVETIDPINSLQGKVERSKVFLHALLFVMGFSLVFTIGWGGSVTLIGQLFGEYKTFIARIGGVIVIMLGLATLGVIHIPWLYADTRSHYQGKAGSYANSALMGLLFAAGWSPCIGATLGAILTLGLSQQTVGQAMWLASGYSIGLGIPFLVMALALESATKWTRQMVSYRRALQVVSSVFLVAIGVLLLTNAMSLISIWAFKNGYYVEAFTRYSAAPTYFTAIIAGLLSFLSPCVLPLVPAYLGYLSGHAIQRTQGQI